jgi:hypothetical protein
MQCRKEHFRKTFVLQNGTCIHLSVSFTERRGLMVNSPASYLLGPGFKSQPGDRLR